MRLWINRATPKSIALRSTLVVIVVAALAGGIYIRYAANLTETRTETRVSERLGELLDTVERTASVACFAQNQALAAEVAAGLLKNSEVQAVSVRVGESPATMHLLARLTRDTAPEIPSASPRVYRRAITSPFSAGQQVGEVIIEPNVAHIRATVEEESRYAGGLLAVQLLIVSLATIGVLMIYLVRPIKTISDDLHRMNARAGERLPIPTGYDGTEFAQLVNDINELSFDLMEALDEERSLRQQKEIDERKYHTIFDNVETAIFLLDLNGWASSANPACVRLFGISDSQSRHGFRLTALDWREPDKLRQVMEECRKLDRTAVGDFELQCADGLNRWVNMILTPVDAVTVQGVANDVTQRLISENQARQMALIDPLTGAWNSQGLDVQLDRHLQFSFDNEETQHVGFALLYLAIKGYSRVKTAFGLEGGEQLSRNVHFRLQGAVKIHDVVAHIGVGLFAIVLDAVTRQREAEGIAERVLAAIGNTFEIAGAPVRLTFDIGIAAIAQPGCDAYKLRRQAELAVEQASREDGGNIRCFSPALEEFADQRRRLETDLRLAIERNQFRLYLQPIVDLQSNRLSGAEALIRWQHDERGLVGPDAFIPLAEETGFIREIGLWALEAACRQLAEWQRQGVDHLYLSVNVSTCQIPDWLSPTALKSAVAAHGVESSQLVLEITEGVMLRDMDKAMGWLEAVREHGFQIYLDDFGTGYSSLSYLKRLPVNRVKVDRSFVRDMGEDNNDRALVGAIIAMAHSLGLQVVAEGVETAAQLKILRSMRCDAAQGYYFSRPVPINDFPDAVQQVATMLTEHATPR